MWTDEDLERLRLCRNRAYHKVNKKRRMHLPASLSSFLLREWQMEKPDAPKITAKNLLAVFTERFNTSTTATTTEVQAAATSAGPGRKRSRNGTPDPAAATGSSEEEHSDKVWSGKHKA